MRKIYLLVVVLIVIGAAVIVFSGRKTDIFDITLPDDLDEYQVNRFNEDLAVLKEMYETNKNDSRFWIGLGNLKSSVRDYKGAVAAYRECLKISPSDIVANINVADIYEKNLNDFPKAEEYYRKAIESSPANYDFYDRLARLYYLKMDRAEDAEKTFLEGLEATSNHQLLLVSLISFYDWSGRTEEMAKYAKILLELYPDENYQREYSQYVQ